MQVSPSPGHPGGSIDARPAAGRDDAYQFGFLGPETAADTGSHRGHPDIVDQADSPEHPALTEPTASPQPPDSTGPQPGYQPGNRPGQNERTTE